MKTLRHSMRAVVTMLGMLACETKSNSTIQADTHNESQAPANRTSWMEPLAPVLAPLGPTVDTPSQTYQEKDVDKPAKQLPSKSLHYPDTLHAAKIEGEVLAQFIVTPGGRYEFGTLKILKSSHKLFSQAVSEGLYLMPFEPAQLKGTPVRQLVIQPFIFSLARSSSDSTI